APLKPDLPVPELHAEPPLHDQEQLVLVLVPVPDELAQELHQLDVLAVEFADDPGAPAVGEAGELLGEVDLLHRAVPSCSGRGASVIAVSGSSGGGHARRHRHLASGVPAGSSPGFNSLMRIFRQRTRYGPDPLAMPWTWSPMKPELSMSSVKSE